MKRKYLSILCPDQKQPSETLLLALDIIASSLHVTFDKYQEVGSSVHRCILSAFAVKEILNGIGLQADVVSVICRIWGANIPAETAESLSFGGKHIMNLGNPDGNAKPNEWLGHLVTSVEDADRTYLIDTTLSRVSRPQWSHLKGTLAIFVERDASVNYEEGKNFPMLANFEKKYWWGISYFLNQDNTLWMNTPDATNESSWRAPSQELIGEIRSKIK